MAHQNSGWGYDRICWCARQPGSSRGRPDSRQHPAATRHRAGPRRSQNTTWREFIESHMAVLAGIDFFTVEVLTWGLVTYYVLFFIHLESRRVSLAGITRHPARPGWSRWRATQRPRVGVTWSAGAMRSTIGTRSSAPRFGRHWRRVESERTIIGEPHLKLCVREIGNEAVNSYPYQQRHAVRTS
jgi:hypothetical protein